MSRDEQPVDDIVALVEATREEPVGRLEPHVTPRDLADLARLHAAGSPQHAKPSRRSADALGRVLALVVLTLLVAAAAVVIAAIAAAATDGQRVTLTDDLDPLWLAMIAVAVLCVAWEAVAWIREELRRHRGGGSP